MRKKNLLLLLFVSIFTIDNSLYSQNTFVNPIFQGQDPWMVQHNGYYYYCGTKNNAIYVYKSEKLTQIHSERKVWEAPSTGWNINDVWTPELHYLNGKWYIYYCAGTGATSCTVSGCESNPVFMQYSGVLESVSDNPQGAYIDKGMLYTGDEYGTPDSEKWAIDFTPLQMNGNLYGLWSGWEDGVDTDYNCCFTKQCIYIAPMSNPYTVTGNRVKLSEPEGWEIGSVQRVNEGPQVLKKNNNVFVVFSGNDFWTQDYALGLLHIDANSDPLNPTNWTKSSEAVFSKTTDVWGVGHCSFVKSPDLTQDWIVYHSKLNQTGGSERIIRAQEFTWDQNDYPVFGTPTSDNVSLPIPSGEELPDYGDNFSDDFSATNYDRWTFYGWDYNVNLYSGKIYLGNDWGGIHIGDKLMLRDNYWTNFTFKADIEIVNGSRDAGLLFRVKEPAVGWDAQKGYFAGLIEGTNRVYLAKMDGENYTHITDESCTVNLSTTYELKVITNGNQISVYVDNQLYIQTTDLSYSEGLVGLRTVETKSSFDNVYIQNNVSPTADFAGVPDTILSGEAVQFTDLSTGTPTSWHWDFGDCNTSSIQNPTHTFSAAGIYDVSLTVNNDFGSNTNTKSNYIIVCDELSLDVQNINGSNIICSGSNINLRANTNIDADFYWYYNGSYVQGSNNPDMYATIEGEYFVIATTDCQSITSQAFNLTEAQDINPGIITGNQNVCKDSLPEILGSQVPGSGQGAINYQWQYSLDNIIWTDISGATEETYSPPVLGSFGTPPFTVYSRRLVTDFCSIDTGNIVTINVIECINAPVCNFSADNTTITESESVSFTDLSTNTPTSWSWDFGDGNGSNQQHPSHVYNTPGVYTVILTASNSGGSSTETKTDYITVDDEVFIKDITERKINISPNPAKEIILISNIYDDAIINLTDITGRCLLNFKCRFETKKINVSKYSKGIYLLNVIIENNKYSYKIIIE